MRKKWRFAGGNLSFSGDVSTGGGQRQVGRNVGIVQVHRRVFGDGRIGRRQGQVAEVGGEVRRVWLGGGVWGRRQAEALAGLS